MGLTYTSNLLHITLNGIIKLIAFLLTKINLALTVGFQSDRFEGEVGLWPATAEQRKLSHFSPTSIE